jgi:hypothetical protein
MKEMIREVPARHRMQVRVGPATHNASRSNAEYPRMGHTGETYVRPNVGR